MLYEFRLWMRRFLGMRCGVCMGRGTLKDAVQAWDCGGPEPMCPHCNGKEDDGDDV